MMSNLEKYLAHITFETEHRKRHLPRPVLSTRYIRGIIKNTIKEQIHSRKTGQTTTDPTIRAQVIAKTRGRCYLCLRQWNPQKAQLLPKLYFAHMQIDHIHPVSKGGPNSISNYMAVCSQCNNRKSDLSLAEYRAGVRKQWRR